MASFVGVDIRGARFSEDGNPLTPDGLNASFSDAIYDENTTYNGVSFVDEFGECQIIPHEY